MDWPVIYFWLNLSHPNGKKFFISNVKSFSHLQIDIFWHFNFFHIRRNGFCWTVKTNSTIEIRTELLVLGLKFKINTKGQIISKGLFGILSSSKNQTKEFDITTMTNSFLGEFEDAKKSFWNYLTFNKLSISLKWQLLPKCAY